jgi:arylsulfatase A-like enzyme
VISLVDDLGWCDVDHRGLLLDLGSDAVSGRSGDVSTASRGVVSAEHEGATWARVYDPKLTLSLHQAYAAQVFIAIRARGKDARKAEVYLDDVPIGQVTLSKEARVLQTATTRLPIDEGLHQVTIRFRGAAGSEEEPFAELDWVRIAVPDGLTRSYGAPTLVDLRAPAAQLGGIPRRGLALRAPTTLACTLRVPEGASFHASVGMMGGGKATATIALREDGAEPIELRRLDVAGGNDARWEDVELSLAPYAGRIVRLELAAIDTAGTGRLLFGDPAVFVEGRAAPEPVRAKAAVIVVLDGVERDELPPWREDAPHAPNLKHLAATATVFEEHRGSTTLVNGAVASLLTGLAPRSHGLVDGGARLPKAVTTLGDIAREASVRAAMFTGVPTTFAAYGFDRHWESFSAFPPNEGRPASAPIDAAAAWLSEVGAKSTDARPMLAVVHARGGHPPWDLTPAEAAKLPPQKYSGAMRARDAAQAIASLQGKFSRLAPADEERLRAMHFAALYGEDAALGRLIRKLQESGLWDSTLLVVTADVSSAMRALFAEVAPLSEEALALPLYVHFPGSSPTSQRVRRDTDSADVARTVLAALGLKPPQELGGRDLAAIAAWPEEEPYHLRVAHGEDGYAARWGDFVLHGKLDGRRPTLCDLVRDPTCAYDHTHARPIVVHALSRRHAAVELAAPRAPEREPLSLDTETAAALKVWGVP